MKERNVRVAGTATSAKPCHVNSLLKYAETDWCDSDKVLEPTGDSVK